MDTQLESPARFVALDIREHAAHVGAVDAAHRVVLRPHTIARAELEHWLCHNLTPADAVVLGMPANPWPLYDQIVALAGSAIIAHPQIAALIPTFQASADPRDTLRLARMHAAGLVPALWAPAAAVRDVRALAAQRGRLIQQHAAAGATLEQLLHEYHARPPGHSRLAADRPDWWARLPLPAAAAQRARDALAAYNRATALLRELDQRLLAISEGEHWRGDIERLLVVAGMDRLSALVLLGVIGDAKRFAAAEQLVGYAGLAPHTQHRGAPSGRHELRATMLDVTERALRHSPEWQARFAELERRIGSGRAHLAIARKLLVQVWQVLAAPAQALGNPADEARERQVRPAA